MLLAESPAQPSPSKVIFSLAKSHRNARKFIFGVISIKPKRTNEFVFNYFSCAGETKRELDFSSRTKDYLPSLLLVSLDISSVPRFGSAACVFLLFRFYIIPFSSPSLEIRLNLKKSQHSSSAAIKWILDKINAMIFIACLAINSPPDIIPSRISVPALPLPRRPFPLLSFYRERSYSLLVVRQQTTQVV